MELQKVLDLNSQKNAGVAQLVEQLICNQPVGGSSPFTSSLKALKQFVLRLFCFKANEKPADSYII